MKFFAILFLIFSGAALQAQDRVALVIGNSNYAGTPLKNPVNDATDVASALKSFGFEVILRTDADLPEMEGALADFLADLKANSTALFYYAGHGVQVEGENYLIPVKEEIGSSADVRTKGLSMAKVMEAIHDSGASTGLVFLDACRDNPFPGVSRSSARGLSVIAAPRDLESLIAFATSPGDVAEDGDGRNGVFTGAFLKNIHTPGATLADIMTKVKADVKAQTNGKQQPRVDDGLSKPFLFSDPAQLALKAKADADKAQAELEALNREIAARKTEIASAQDESSQRDLELAQKKELARAAVKKLEAESLAQEAEARRQEADQAQKDREEKQEAQELDQARQKELASLAAQKKAEAEKLAADAENPDALVEEIEKLDGSLEDIRQEYASAWEKTKTEIDKRYAQKASEVAAEAEDPTESDSEFTARIKQESGQVETDFKKELADKERQNNENYLAQSKSLADELAERVRTLESKSFVLKGKSVLVLPCPFDKDTKRWPFTVRSDNPDLPFEGTLALNLKDSPDLKQAYKNLDTANKAGALSGVIRYSVQRSPGEGRYYLKVSSFEIDDLTQASTVVSQTLNGRVAYFLPGKSRKTVAFSVPVNFTSAVAGSAVISVDGINVGDTPKKVPLLEGTHQIEYRWPTGESSTEEIRLTGPNPLDFTLRPPYQVGDIGPAGGLIFSVEDGKCLEAAPQDLGNLPYDDAVTACRAYCSRGFGDWRLPTGDELRLMYENLQKNHLGSFWEAGEYWSFANGEGLFFATSFDNGRSRAIDSRESHPIRPVRESSTKDLQQENALKARAKSQPKFVIGAKGPAGGLVFDVVLASDGSWRYLEAAPQDLGNFPYNTAIEACPIYSSRGFEDWRLPTQIELNKMYESLQKSRIGGFWGDGWYWSSSVGSDPMKVWGQYFGNGQMGCGSRNDNRQLRLVRESSDEDLKHETYLKARTKRQPKYEIGAKGPAGGLVFNVILESDGSWRYLEAAPQDLGSFQYSTAVEACHSYSSQGYNDWRFPTNVELNQMFENLQKSRLGGFWGDGWYWSSSDGSAPMKVWGQYFGNGQMSFSSKNDSHQLRPVRESSDDDLKRDIFRKTAAKTPPKYAIGSQGPADGLIFNVILQPDGSWHYLEVAPKDLGSLTYDNAVESCRTFLTRGVSDWRLPTNVELNQMYENLYKRKLGAFWGDGWYWSSTGGPNPMTYWVQYFGNGQMGFGDKNESHPFRPVREF